MGRAGVSATAARALFSAKTHWKGSRSAAIFDIVAAGIDIAAAILAIIVVRRLTARQVERTRLLATSGPLAAGSAGLPDGA